MREGAQAAVHAHPRSALADVHPVGRLPVGELVHDAQPHGVAVGGRQSCERRLQALGHGLRIEPLDRVEFGVTREARLLEDSEPIR